MCIRDSERRVLVLAELEVRGEAEDEQDDEQVARQRPMLERPARDVERALRLGPQRQRGFSPGGDQNIACADGGIAHRAVADAAASAVIGASGSAYRRTFWPGLKTWTPAV